MKLSQITKSPLPFSPHPDVQELLCRFHDNQEIDCPYLDNGDRAFIGAIFNEVIDNPNYLPTINMLELIRVVNAKMEITAKGQRLRA